jgi:hypothetical protein
VTPVSNDGDPGNDVAGGAVDVKVERLALSVVTVVVEVLDLVVELVVELRLAYVEAVLTLGLCVLADMEIESARVPANAVDFVWCVTLLKMRCIGFPDMVDEHARVCVGEGSNVPEASLTAINLVYRASLLAIAIRHVYCKLVAYPLIARN